jgi:hypothetical protein
MIRAMRKFIVLFTLIVLLAAALGLAWLASDWPHWCRVLGWCTGRGLL